jgi:hypothetical protein
MLGAHLPQECQVPTLGGTFGGPRGPQNRSAPTTEGHYHLLRGIRLPRQHGRSRRAAAHHRPCCRQHAATSRVDRRRGRPQCYQPRNIQTAAGPRVADGAFSPIFWGGPAARIPPRAHNAPGYIWDERELSYIKHPVRRHGGQPSF